MKTVEVIKEIKDYALVQLKVTSMMSNGIEECLKITKDNDINIYLVNGVNEYWLINPEGKVTLVIGMINDKLIELLKTKNPTE